MTTKRIYAVVPGGLTSVGGMCRMAAYYVTEWHERGRSPEIVVIDSFGPYVKWRMPFHFTWACLRILTAGQLGRIVLLHIHMAEYGSALRKGILAYLGRALGVPIVIHLHAAEFAEFCEWLSPRGRARLVAMLNLADRIIVLGTPWESYLTTRLGIPADKIVIMRNAVPDPQTDRLAARRGGPCRLLFLGVLGTRKGLDELLPALAAPALRDLGWEADFAGNGDIEKYRQIAEDLGLGSRVRFHGWTDAVTTEALLAESDVLLLPSHNEGLPMAIIEAMAHSLAVIATPVGAIGDAIVNDETGLIVPVGDAAFLTEAIRRVVADSRLRDRLGTAARKRFLTEFELSSFNDRLEALMRSLIAE